ncbi:DUF1690-domain-containing protein [Cryphonectria parasitica EP155]|uniref:DUF1690-domain-containing protein n=1 Tax=Cryphonectria parasitica (strain ATCC 38755 / EP155) TaxID=660469 RepID=A0A9P4Y8B3_CRYP1|nr:DUF1690-domain-containing protein [Cryphonectria parasitica EP155]KAF3768802.1 DUF1690-domain-containing protein [Cryphonectria parasitica EP155]
MGANSSKESGPAPTYLWKGSSPASVSQDMVESLQSSSETDTTRTTLLESQIQARVAAELRKLSRESDAQLSSVLSKVGSSGKEEGEGSKDKDGAAPLSQHAVNADVERLRKKVEARRLVREVPESVEEARGDVVRCLRENDRRPLDCWREVERFREEVRRMEKGWVERIIS